MTPKKEEKEEELKKEKKEEKEEKEEKPEKKILKAKIEPEEPKPIQFPIPEMPTLVNFNEFLGSLYRTQRFESVGGFVYWMKKQGIPKKLSVERWKEYFDEFVNRKV